MSEHIKKTAITAAGYFYQNRQGLRGDDVVAVMERIRQTKQRVPQRLQT